MNLRTKWILQNKKDNMSWSINLYRSNIEYYCPPKLDREPVAQNHSTILWKSEVNFNGKEPVIIKYTNPDYSSAIKIIINGVSFSNLYGTERASYLIH